MNMLLALTGTPVTNKLDTLPQLLDIVSNGRAPLGDKQSFSDRYMAPSKVMLALGSKKPPRTDINPQYAAELGAVLQQYMHVAMPEDVRGKTTPAVLLDENQPAHMIGMQEKMYRAAMASLTHEDRERVAPRLPDYGVVNGIAYRPPGRSGGLGREVDPEVAESPPAPCTRPWRRF